MTETTTQARPRPHALPPSLLSAERRQTAGAADRLPAEEVLALVCRLPVVARIPADRKNSRLGGLPVILDGLAAASWRELAGALAGRGC
jgi:hypothetical protein